MNTMFDTLLQLPLFQGLGHGDFTSILEKTKLHFTRYNEGDVVIEQGTSCDQLFFLLKGELSIETTSNDGTYTFIEKIEAPAVIEPQSLFGMKVHYASNYTALTEVNAITICKSFVLTGLMNYDIFRLNYMNIISNRAQSFYHRIWETAPQGVEEKIVHFILQHVERPQGEKTLKVKMESLAACLDDTRLNVSKALNSMQEKGVVVLKRKEIYIPEVSKLIWVSSKVDCVIY